MQASTTELGRLFQVLTTRADNHVLDDGSESDPP